MNEPTITLTGNLAAKPQLRSVDQSNAVVVANLRVAVTPRRRSRDQEDWVDGETMWFNVSAWRSAALNAVVSLNQGDRVMIRGRLSQRTWTDAEGVERPSLTVDADDVALDISRHPAMSLRRPPAQRQSDGRPEAAAGDDDGWVSTGQVDTETGEVLVERSPDGAAAPEQDQPTPV